MPRSDTTQLTQFLSPFDPEIQQLALWLRDIIWHHYPTCNELIYDNYNALAVGWSPTEKMSDIFCSFAVYGNKDVHFGFYWGSQLPDPEKMLLGAGKQYRYIRVSDKAGFPEAYVMAEAYSYSMSKLKPAAKLIEGQTIVKSISEIRKRPGVITPKKIKTK